MLSKILREFKESKGPLNLKELARRLDVQQSALGGMLDTLVRQGKLREITPADCAQCAKSGHCEHRSRLTGKSYELVE